MEQGNCLDSTRMPAAQEARGTNDKPALDVAIVDLLQAPSQNDSVTNIPPFNELVIASPVLAALVREWSGL